MDQETGKEGLRILEELVLDASEPVSYRRLASVLCVHVNYSKILLKQFSDTHAKENDLYVSMVVCGTTRDGNARTVICPQTELKDVKESFKKIMYEHIYGVSKTRAALEGAALAASAGGFEDFTPTVGAVCSALCTKLSNEEIDKIKTNSYKSLNNDCTASSNTMKDESKLTNKLKNDAKPSEKFKDESKNKQNGLFFKNNEVKENNSLPSLEKHKSNTNVEQKGTTPQNKSSKAPGKKDISSFFNRDNGKTSIKPAAKAIKEEPKEEKADEHKLPSVQCSTSTIKNKSEPITPKIEPITPKKEPITPKKEPKLINKSEKKSKSKDRKSNAGEVEAKKSTSRSNEIVSTKRNGKVDKKRKRVLCISDSEDSNDDKDPFEEPSKEIKEESDEDIIPPTPNADVVKITSGITNPKKRRKIVDKTYITDDGYMVTRKEEVYESCSDDDVEMKENVFEKNVKEPIVVKKTPVTAPTRKSKKKIASPQKTKQASISSFFKKK